MHLFGKLYLNLVDPITNFLFCHADFWFQFSAVTTAFILKMEMSPELKNILKSEQSLA